MKKWAICCLIICTALLVLEAIILGGYVAYRALQHRYRVIGSVTTLGNNESRVEVPVVH